MCDASTAVAVITWTGTILFVATALITVLGLVGVLKLGGGDGSSHGHYMKWLFSILIVEIVTVSLVSFSSTLRAQSNALDRQSAQIQVLDSTRALAVAAQLQTQSIADSLAAVTSALSRRLSSVAVNAAITSADSVQQVMERRTDRLTRDINVATLRTDVDTVRLRIPTGWTYSDHRVDVLARRGDGRHEVVLVRDNSGEVTEVLLIVSARARRVNIMPPTAAMYSARMSVTIQEESDGSS